MPRTVAEIEAHLPERAARKGIEIAAACALGKARHAHRDHALQHQCEALGHFGRRLADGDGAGDVGGAVRVLPARIDEIDRVPLDRPVAAAADTVVRHGGMGASRGNGIEAQILGTSLDTERLQVLSCRNLGEPALSRFTVEPGKEAHHSHGIASVGPARTIDLGPRLARLGEQCRVFAAADIGACRRQPVEEPLARLVGIEPDAGLVAAECGEGLLQRVGFPELGDGFQMPAHIAADLGRIHEQLRLAARMGNGEGQHRGRVRQVGTADIEQPRDGFGAGEHDGILACVLQGLAETGDLVRARRAGELDGMGHHGTPRRLRPILPERVDRVVLRGGELDPLLVQLAGKLLDRRDRMQPGIVADTGAFARVGDQPVRELFAGHLLDLEYRAVRLLSGLHRVAAIDEEGGLLCQHRRHARRAGKACEPEQPLGTLGDVLALMRVGLGHDEAGKAQPFQLLAQQCDARLADGRVGDVIEALEHGVLAGCTRVPICPSGACARGDSIHTALVGWVEPLRRRPNSNRHDTKNGVCGRWVFARPKTAGLDPTYEIPFVAWARPFHRVQLAAVGYVGSPSCLLIASMLPLAASLAG